MRPPSFHRVVALLLLPALAMGLVGPVSNDTAGRDGTLPLQFIGPFRSQTLMLAPGSFSGLWTEKAHRQIVHVYRQITLKNVLTVSAMLSVFCAGIAFDVHFLEDKVTESIVFNRLSFLILATTSAFSGSLLSQWLLVRKGKEKSIRWAPVGRLMLLAIFHSTVVEAWAWEALERIHFFSHPLLNALAQTAMDFFVLSLFLATAWAMLFYARHLHPRNSEEALKEIREEFLGFYMQHEWKWALWMLPAMLTAHHPIISNTFFQLGVLTWNVSFDSHDFPNSRGKIEEIANKNWFGWLIAWPLRAIQWGLEQSWYRHFIVNTLVAAQLLAAFDFINRWPLTHLWADTFLKFTSLLWIAWLFRPKPLRPLRLFPWLAPFILIAPLFAQPALPPAPARAAWVTAKEFDGQALAQNTFSFRHGPPQDWRSIFLRQMKAASRRWNKRRVMPQPDVFVEVLHVLADEVDDVIGVSQSIAPDPEKKWVKRLESLILLGQLMEGWMDPVHSDSIRLVATVCKSEKVSHWLLYMANDKTGPVWAHVVTRANPEKPRVKITFWRDGEIDPHKAALIQFRIGWDKDLEAHLDAVRADKPSTATKAWAPHRPVQAFQRPKLTRNAIHNGLLWVRDITRQTAAFRHVPAIRSNPVFEWIPFPGTIVQPISRAARAA